MTQASPKKVKGKKEVRGIVGENPQDVESFFYNLGYDLTTNSLEFMAGVVVGLFKLMGDLLFGGIETLENTRNPVIKQQSQAAIVGAAYDKISLADIEKLRQGQKLDDNNTNQLAAFIDTVNKNGLNYFDVKNNKGEIELAGYLFERTELENGRGYRVFDADSGKNIISFEIDKDEVVKVIPTKASAEDRTKMMDFITKTGIDFNMNLQSTDLNKINDKNIQQNIFEIELELARMNESIGSIEPSTTDTRDQKRLDREDLLAQRARLFQLEDLATTIGDIIVEKSVALANEIQRNPSGDNRTQTAELTILTNRLEGIVEAIDSVETNIATKEAAINDLGIAKAGVTIQAKIAAGIAANAEATAQNNAVTSTQTQIEQNLPGLKTESPVPKAAEIDEAAFNPYEMTHSEESDDGEYSEYLNSSPEAVNSSTAANPASATSSGKTFVAVTPVPESQFPTSTQPLVQAQ